MMTNEQIEAAIAELHAQAEQKLSSVKRDFADAAKLRMQAKYLRKILDVRTAMNLRVKLTSLIVLGCVQHEHAESAAFCAVAWSGPQTDMSEPQIFLRCGWETLLPKDAVSFFSALLNDWRELLQTNPDLVLATIKELSVGPIRTMEERMLEEDEVMEFLRKRIGEVVRFPRAIRIK